MVTAALRSLETNPANANADTKVASLGKRYAVVYITLDETLQTEIIPVMIEGPPPVSPPDELQHLHFNDKLLYLIALSN